jgi:hypothetical protein
MRYIKAFFCWFALFLGADNALRRQGVSEGICDYSGQGRDRYGRR